MIKVIARVVFLAVVMSLMFTVSVQAQTQTIAKTQIQLNSIQQEHNFLTSIVTQIQNRRTLLELWGRDLKKEIKKMEQREASRKRAFEAHKKNQAEKAAKEKAEKVEKKAQAEKMKAKEEATKEKPEPKPDPELKE